MLTSDLDYPLPPDLIATTPAEPRDAARLMVVYRGSDRVEHRTVRDLPALGVLRAGDVMVFNSTRVLPACFTGTRRGTGGHVTGLYLGTPGPGRWSVMLECRGSLRAGESVDLDGTASLLLVEPRGGGQWEAELRSDADTLALLHRVGVTPLPPYIRKARKAQHRPEVSAADSERYNTVFAEEPGSVAAPTAALHFTPALLERIDALGVDRQTVTLHIGLGTFAPVRTEHVEQHPIHSEPIAVAGRTIAALRQARARGSRIVAVGTTTVRALESLPPHTLGDSPGGLLAHGYTTETDLFITPADGQRPGFAFRFTDALMTNFHLPRSTLLALVAALPGVGVDRLKRWYDTAVGEGYRFYSYGDAMVIV